MSGLAHIPQRGEMANGIPFTVLHRPGAGVTSVSVWVLSGSRHERVPGVAHLIEHLVMQAVPEGRSMRVVDEIESWGGDANAMTTRDHVVLWARVPTPDAAAALEVLVDSITSATLDDELIEGERRVVQEELRLAGADPTDIVHDVFFATAFGDAPFGRPVGGTLDGVAAINLADIHHWIEENVRAERLAVVVNGGLDSDAVAKVLTDSRLAAIRPAERTQPTDTAPRLVSGRRDLIMSSETAGVVIGGPGFALGDPRLGAANVVSELLAGANASVLNEEIRSRRGLSYDVSGGVSGYRDTGIWRIGISTAPENCDEVVDLAVTLIREAVARGWSEAEVAPARRRAAGLARLEAESSLEEALTYGDFALVGAVSDWSLTAFVEQLEAFTSADINTSARLMVENLAIATAGGTARP